MKYTVEEWKEIVKDYLLEQNAKIAAGKGATDDKVMLERMRKENLHFVNRILKDYLPTLADYKRSLFVCLIGGSSKGLPFFLSFF